MHELENYCFGFDRDGTLESNESPFPVHLSEQIASLRAKGAKTFIASGRSLAELMDIIQTHQLQFDWICGENGAAIFDANNSATPLYPDLEAFKTAVQAITLPPSTADKKQAIWTHYFHEHLPIAEKMVQDLIAQNRWQLKTYAHPDYEGALDVVPLAISKAELLRYIPTHLSIVYFGDSENDVEIMLSDRVQPHTVQNAKPVVKNIVREKQGIIAEQMAGLGVSYILATLFDV